MKKLKEHEGKILLLIGLFLIASKLQGAIDWSWWIVLIPFYLGIGMKIIFATIKSIIKWMNK